MSGSQDDFPIFWEMDPNLSCLSQLVLTQKQLLQLQAQLGPHAILMLTTCFEVPRSTLTSDQLTKNLSFPLPLCFDNYLEQLTELRKAP